MSSTTRSAGTRFGPYEIVAPLGAGGMGEVYRARDTTLQRDVALKFLPESLAGDASRLARFEREAQTLASLNHPNIAQVYGFHDGALIMELLDGETLTDRLAGGPLPVRKAVEYGSQIARGLAAAHDRGIIHRDLKPDNVFVLRDGHIKIIDFGLARETASPATGVTATQTIARTDTEPGTVMGTVGYMAPEQVRGELLDPRADLFALGAVLYEMLAGRRAFKRDTAAETMTAILREDPEELTSSRVDVNPGLDRIVRHCLEKNPIERFQTARDVAFALDSLSTAGSGSGPASVAAAPRTGRVTRERWIWASMVAALALLVAWLALAPPPAPAAAATAPPVVRALIMLPEGVRLSVAWVPIVRLAMSSDGRHVVFVGVHEGTGRVPSLWIHALDGSSTREIPGTNEGSGPRFSPDGKSIFFSTQVAMKRVDLAGGTPMVLGGEGYGPWTPGGEIVSSTGPPAWTLQRRSASGGTVTDIRKPQAPDRLGIPSLLPDGRRFLFPRFTPQGTVVEVGSLDSNELTTVLQLAGTATIQSAAGAIVYGLNDRIFAQAFDATTLRVSGEPVVLADRVDFQGNWGTAFAVSDAGSLVFQSQDAGDGSRLTWMDRQGRVLSTVSDGADYNNLELSHDQQRLAVSVLDPAKNTRDIHIIDLARGVRQRLTFDDSEERSMAWSSDGRSIIYNSKGLDLYRRSSDFTGGEEPVQTDHASKDPREVSSDGQRLLYRRTGQGTDNDIWMMPLSGDRQPVALLNSPFDENYAAFSPDGRSIVYVSNESGRWEIYVMSLESGGGKVQISTGGGSFPRWRRDGREITYLSLDNVLTAVSVTGSGPAFRAGATTTLFTMNPVPGPATPYDVTADGTRFIVNARRTSRLPPSLNFILNWPSLLKKQ